MEDGFNGEESQKSRGQQSLSSYTHPAMMKANVK
jgi:hypothetical protein